MINLSMPNAASGKQKLKIKPLVVPRKFTAGRLYFYIVFTFARVNGNGKKLERPDGKALDPADIAPFLLDEQKAWPTYLLDRLKKNLCQFGVRVSRDDANFRTWKSIRVENPMGANPVDPNGLADWGFETKDGQVVEVESGRWEKQAAALWTELVVKSIKKGHAHNCAFQPKQEVYFKDQNLGDLYFNARGGSIPTPTANPSVASDLRPGLRLEGISSRSIAKGLREARNQLQDNPLPHDPDNPPGMQVILETGNNEFKEFVRYLVGKDVKYEEIAAFVVNTRRTWLRALEGNQDPKFRDVFRRRMIASWNNSQTLDNVFKAYQDFLIYLGQGEIRRHGRFLDGARHRLVLNKSTAHATSAGNSSFRNVSLPQGNGSATDVPYIGFEDIVAQVQRYPGLMRRLGLAVYCSVDWNDPDPLGANADQTRSLDLPLDGALSWVRIHCDDESPDHDWFIEPPTPTYCDLQLNKLFRAAAEDPTTFSTPPDAPCQDADGLNAWQRYHVLPSSFYLVTQDDYSLAAARGDTSITPGKGPSAQTPGIETDLGQFTRNEVNSVNFYFAPIDDEGHPITVAQWLDQHMTRKAQKIGDAELAMSIIAEEQATKRMLASLTSEMMLAAVTTFPKVFNVDHAIYAEQLIQGHTIDVFRPGKDDHWRSLCRRMVRVDLYPDGSLGREFKNASRSWWFEDEGFLATSTLVAPRPYVGRLTSDPKLGTDASDTTISTSTLDIEVIDTNNRIAFNCKGTARTGVNLSCIIHPLCDITDVFASDMVIATPSGSPLSDQNKTNITVVDLDVHPIFYSANGLANVALQDLGSLKLIVADNKAPAAGGAVVSPRGNEQFPILVASHGTRFLDTLGNVIAGAVDAPDANAPAAAVRAPTANARGSASVTLPTLPVKNILPPDFQYFTIEGERRYYSANWTADNSFVPVGLAGTIDFKNALGILSPLGAAELLTSDHLNVATDACDLLTVPNTEAALPKSDPDVNNPYGQAGIAEKLCHLGKSSTLKLVRGQVVQVDFDLKVKVVKATGSVPVAQRLVIGTTPWKIDGGTLPNIPLPDNKTLCQLTLSAPNASVDASQTLELVLHIKGSAGIPDSGAKSIAAVVSQFDILDRRTPSDKDPLNPQLTITWSIKLKDFNKNSYSFNYDQPQLDGSGTQPNDRFLHPAGSLGWYVESIGTAQANAITGRALPQHLLGTLANSANSAVSLYFSDGTSRIVDPLPPITGQMPGTRFFQVHEVVTNASSLGTATPKLAPCSGAATSNVNGFTVAGEIVRISTTAPYQVDISDLDQNVWTLRWPSDTKIRAAFSGLPGRPVTDLELGEFMVAHCDVVGSTNSSLRQLVIQTISVPDLPNQTFARGVVCLFGTIDTSSVPRMTDVRALAEGSTIYRQINMASERQRQIEIWYTAQSLRNVPVQGKIKVVAPSIRVIFAETATQYALPTAQQNTDSSTGSTPLHATVSEIIGRWGNWSLTVPMPGNTDPIKSDFIQPKNSRFKLQSIRPDISHLDVKSVWRDSWALPTMRFGQTYWFCVRRVDLAGNHFYDERLPEFQKLPKCAVSTLTTWEQQVDDVEGGQNSSAAESASDFRRADLPSSPVLAFKSGRELPVYFQNTATLSTSATTAATVSNNSAVLPVSSPMSRRWRGYREVVICPTCGQEGCPGGNACRSNDRGFAYLAYKRPRELFLLSDAFDTKKSSVIDAKALLLPPVCQVETIYLQGNLDSKNYRDAARCIERHDRQRGKSKGNDDKTKSLLAMRDDGGLNYLGDVDARMMQIQIFSYDTDKEWSNKQLVDLVSPNQWPKARRVMLQLTAVANESTVRNALPSLEPCNVPAVALQAPVEAQKADVDSLVTLALPRGTTGQAVLLLENDDLLSTNGKNARPRKTGNNIIKRPTWRNISLIHATNAAMAKPRWDSLVEAPTSNGSGTADTNRTLSYSFHIDRPSSGSYKVLAYWNELWDEAVPKQHQPAEFVITAECGVAKKAKCVMPGFGYGATAVVLFESPTGANVTLPGINIAPNKGLVNDASFSFVSFGKNCPDTMRIRVMRRPPLVRIAEAYAVIRNGRIEQVEVVSGGGWYQSAPFVVAHDPQGNGSGAILTAVLDKFGQVTAVDVNVDPSGGPTGGVRYSEQTRIVFYTHQYQLPEQAIETVETLLNATPKPGNDFDYDLISSSFNQAFGNAGTRTVDYVVQVNSRFRDYLRPPPPGMVGNDIALERSLRTHVPRYSAPNEVVFRSQAKLLKPPVDYILRSFQWHVLDSAQSSIRNARSYFLGRTQGQITVRREPFVRIYMFRPWNVSGSEQLGVVVCPAILNTIRLPVVVPAGSSSPDDTILKGDDGAYNVVASEGAKEPSVAAEPIDGYVIQRALRNLVSRVGFDPTQREEAHPPLHVDQFTARTPGTIYEYVSNSDLATASPDSTPAVQQPVWIAAHDVHYDSAKERWYSDVRVAGAQEGVRSVPMLQLALVTYQSNGVPGNRISSIYRSDVIKLLGDRTLEVTRKEQFKFALTLRGQFDDPDPPAKLPERHVIAKLLCRSSALPDEIVVYQPATSNPQPHARLLGLAESDSADLSATIVDEVRFSKPKTSGDYTLDVDFNHELIERMKVLNMQWTLAVEEYEVFAAAEAARDRTGDHVSLRSGQATSRQLVFSYAFDI